jgi:hypothetical protein
MSILTLRCTDCHGQIAMTPGLSVPTCPFCDAEQLVEQPLEKNFIQPTSMIDFEIDESIADEAFREFSQSSWWYPAEIKTARLELRRLMIPAWRWSVDIESHFAALVSAQTESGKKPLTGVDRMQLEQILTPASAAVTTAEINAIAPFVSQHQTAHVSESLPYPFEVAILTEEVATQRAMTLAISTHRSRLTSTHSASEMNVSSVFHTLDGQPALLPVYIGVYRQNDYPYRILINGISGKLTGKAPIDKKKVLMIVGLVLVSFYLILLCTGAIKLSIPVI